jgi:hypothetical protein
LPGIMDGTFNGADHLLAPFQYFRGWLADQI